MKKLTKYIIIFFIVNTNYYAQNITNLFAESFIQTLINDSVKLKEFVNIEELKLSERLGISYIDSKSKFLISKDIASKIKFDLQKHKVDYTFAIDQLQKNYSKIILQIPKYKIKKEYYFYKLKLISQTNYYTRNWNLQTSKYFEFHISESKLFNDYSKRKLDHFVEGMLKLLEFDENEIDKLQKEKIHYYLCKDENEIELLTNYKTRGLYYLPYDYIISTFNCHYHEILHLLINYKIQRNELYTLSLLQEGFAVAYGGRGGKEPNVILENGLFLANNNFIDYKQLLSKKNFYNFDASISYPYSGLYVKFLIENLGIKKFLELYKKYSGNQTKIDLLKITQTELPLASEWKIYLSDYEEKSTISVTPQNDIKLLSAFSNTDTYCIYENAANYIFKLKESVEIHIANNVSNYKSKLFENIFPKNTFRNQKYIITANTNEISVYNFFSNNLIAKYVKGFSLKNQSVPKDDDFFVFTISKKVFDEPLENCIINKFDKIIN